MEDGNIYFGFLDVLIILPLFWAIYRGFITGYITEGLSLSVFIVSIYLYIRLTEIPGLFSPKIQATLEYLPLIVFIIALVIAFVLSNLTEKFSHRSIKDLVRGGINRTLGAFLSLLRYLLFISCIVVVIQKLDDKYTFLNTRQKNSVLYKPVSELAPIVFPYLEFEHIKNRYISMVKSGELQLDNNQGIIKMKDALYNLAGESDQNRELSWNSHEMKENTDYVVVELNVNKKKGIINKVAKFRFIVHKRKGTIQLQEYKVNQKSRKKEEAINAMQSGEF